MNLIGVVILIGLGVLLASAFIGLLHAVGVALIVVGVLLFLLIVCDVIPARGHVGRRVR